MFTYHKQIIQYHIKIKIIQYNKISDPSYVNELTSYGITFLSETHTGLENHIDVEGFQHIPICRPIARNNRYYGGLAVLIRKSIRSGITILKNTSSEFQWMKLSKTFFNLEKDIFVCFSYVSPCSFQHKSDADTLEAIVRDINIF